MKFQKIDQKYIVRLEKDEEIVAELTQLCQMEKINFGTILGIGGATNVTLGYYELSAKSYHWRSFSGDLEITSLTGNISLVDNKPFLHIHSVISTESFNCFGGHLKQAKVAATGEVIIEKIDSFVERKMNVEVGLNLLDLK